MAFLTACRKARAWQQQLRTLASLHSLQNDPTSPAISWVYAQRFHSTTTTPSMAAAAAVATEVPVVQPPKPAGKYRRFPKRQKLDHDDILGTATRVFNMSLGTEKGFIDDGSGEEEEARDVTTDAEPRPVISPELLEEHEERLKAMDKKRAKYPLMAGRTLESWFTKHEQDLQPFLTFLHSHGADQTKTIAALYFSGYWGRRAMLPAIKSSNSIQLVRKSFKHSDQSPLPLFEENFADWADMLKKEDVHLTAGDLLLLWPGMLTRIPVNMGTTLAILRAALPQDGSVDIQQVIKKAPRILGTNPVELQKRLVKLQLATEGELQHMIPGAPMVLTLPLDGVYGNLRLVKEHSRSSREYKSFLHTSPSAIARPVKYLQTAASVIRKHLKEVLPPGVDPVEVIKAKPQLLLVRGTWLAQRWEAIEEAVQLLDEWKEEFNSLIEDARAMSSAHDTTSSSTTTTSSPLLERVGDGSDAIPSPPAPEWATKDLDPRSLGVLAQQQEQKAQESSQEFNENEENGSSGDQNEILMKGRIAYSALGEALWMRPWRIQRLEYMAEQFPEEATTVSFISAMAVTLEQFEERYPEFSEWVHMKQEEGAYNRFREGKDAREGLF